MKRVAKKNTPIQEFARKLGYAVGRAVATTQELAGNAAAMVDHDDTPATQQTKESSPAARTPRKHSARRAAKKASSSSTASRTKSKKSATVKSRRE